MKILLIHPAWAGIGDRKKIKVSEKLTHPLTLGIIASLIKNFRPDSQITILNEAVETISYGIKWDWVGITVNTYTAIHAYAIAQNFKNQQIPVIFGGIHPTFCSQECLNYADSVITGEAEIIIEELLQDLEDKKLKKIYIGGSTKNLDLIPQPDRTLFKNRSTSAFVQATRGCGNICKFCYLRYVPWGDYRKRPVLNVIDEIKALKEKIILFVDDNLFVDRAYCMELFQQLKPLSKFWWIQAPTTIASDTELLQCMADSGCFAVSYGFQTIQKPSIEGDHIFHNKVEKYREIVKNTQKTGIMVDGTFIFGFDGDSPQIFKDTVKMIKVMDVDTYTFYFYTVYPGTSHYNSFLKEGRLDSDNWEHFDWDHPVVIPKNMTSKELKKGVKWAYQSLDSYYKKRFFRHLIRQIFLIIKSFKLAVFLLSSGRPRPYKERSI